MLLPFLASLYKILEKPDAQVTLYPGRISCGCSVVHTLTGMCFCTIISCIKLVPVRYLVRIPDEVCLISFHLKNCNYSVLFNRMAIGISRWDF